MACKIQPSQMTNKRNNYTIISLPQREVENPSFEWNIFKFFKNRKNPHTQDGREYKSPLSVRTRISILIFGFTFLVIIFYIEYYRNFRLFSS
uniref:Uncharacterized protein n=1 Tax=Strongyloides papillosus TaxID=174720 RepID=A0A0N5BDF4_STREA